MRPQSRKLIKQIAKQDDGHQIQQHPKHLRARLDPVGILQHGILEGIGMGRVGAAMIWRKRVSTCGKHLH